MRFSFRRLRRHAASAPKRGRALIKSLGPGLVAGAADDDPSGIATYSQAGAQFGLGMLWTAVLTFPLMVGIQIVSARIGRVTGLGIAANIRAHYSKPLLVFIVTLLTLANILNLGADLGAMAAAMHLVAGGNYHAYLVGFAVFSLALQVFIPFPRYAPLLKLMTLSLLAYVGAVLFVEVNWGVVLRRAVWPSFTWSREYLLTLVAVLGTTISPYLFFWQAGQEVEELRSIPSNAPLRDSPDGARAQLRRIKIDTYLGMAFSNLVALFIMITTAATLNTAGITDIQTTQQAAEALRPLAGEYAFLLFTLGVVGTGLLAVPILAGSAAYAVSEAFGWRASLSERPLTATGFYGVMIAATLVGVALTFNDVDPIRELFWSAVLNGVIAVPIMAVMMRLAVRADVMGSFVITRRLKFLGWLCTGVMATAVIATIVSSVT